MYVPDWVAGLVIVFVLGYLFGMHMMSRPSMTAHDVPTPASNGAKKGSLPAQLGRDASTGDALFPEVPSEALLPSCSMQPPTTMWLGNKAKCFSCEKQMVLEPAMASAVAQEGRYFGGMPRAGWVETALPSTCQVNGSCKGV